MSGQGEGGLDIDSYAWMQRMEGRGWHGPKSLVWTTQHGRGDWAASCSSNETFIGSCSLWDIIGVLMDVI